jgi:hypothetical protein
MNDLLSIEIPVHEKKQVNNLCISLESARFLSSILKSKVESLEDPLRKDITQLKHLIHQKVFTPKEHLFDEVHKHLFKSSKSVNYILLQNSGLVDLPQRRVLEGWKITLNELLLEIDLKHYHNVCTYTVDSSERMTFMSFLRKVYDSPELFVESSKKEIKVKLMTCTLMKLGNVNVISDEFINALIFNYSKDVDDLQKRMWSIKMNKVVDDLELMIEKQREANTELGTEVIPLLIAGYIIDMKEFSFSIVESELRMSVEELKEKFINNLVNEFENTKVLKLVTNKVKQKYNVKCVLRPTACKKKIEEEIKFKGKSIKDFINFYKNIPYLSKLVTHKEDHSKFCKFYRRFMEMVNRAITEEFVLPTFDNEQVNSIMIHIERDIITRLYHTYINT